jgi:putative hydrolase of the HAD superfamily
MIRAIVFDAVGTLIHCKPSVGGIYAEFGQRYGSRQDEAAIKSRFALAFAKQDQLDAEAGQRTSEKRERQRWRDIVAEVLDDVNDSEACFRELYDAFASPRYWHCASETQPILATLQQRGFSLVLASNFDQRLRGLFGELKELQAINHLVISSEIGWRKPGGEFFRHVGEDLAMRPDEMLYVGDDRVNDYDGATQAGLPAKLLDPTGKHLDLGADRITSLAELLQMV